MKKNKIKSRKLTMMKIEAQQQQQISFSIINNNKISEEDTIKYIEWISTVKIRHTSKRSFGFFLNLIYGKD